MISDVPATGIPPLDRQSADALLLQLFAYPVPLGWGTGFTAEGVTVVHGTAFFMQTSRALFGTTAAHVVKEYLKQRELTPQTICQLGGAEFDLAAALIDYGERPDIATFRVSERLVSELRKQPITGWPPLVPERGNAILYAGYPANLRDRLSPNDFSYGLYGAHNVVDDVDDRKIRAVLDRERFVNTLGGSVPPEGYDLGGMSGGPLAMLVEKAGVISWRLGGVISEGLAMADALWACRADALDDDGRVRR